MNGCPGEPGDEAIEPQLACLKNCKALPHDGHIAFIEIAEGAGRGPAGDAALDEPADVSPLLDCHLRYTGERFPILLKARSISDHEDLRVARHTELGLDPHASGAIRGCIKP